MNSHIFVENSTMSSPVSVTKPLKHIQKIIDCIEPYAEKFTPSKGEVLRYLQSNKRMCYLLLEGSASLHRRGDGMILHSEQGPFILGLSNLQIQHDHLYIRAMADAKMSRLPSERLMLLIQKEGLWESLYHLITYTASKVYEHCIMISQLSSYEIIKFQLIELMQEPERTRLNITAANYIQDRTYLSRSGIMKILLSLKTGGHIELDRGKLLKMNSLPQKY